MSEVAKAVEEVVDAMVANLSFDEGTKPNANPIPEKSTETDTHKSESNDSVEKEEPVPAPSSDSPSAAKIDIKGTPNSVRKERHDSSGEAATEADHNSVDEAAPEGTVNSEDSAASGPVPMNVASEKGKAKKKKVNSKQRRKLRDQKAAAEAEAGTAASNTESATKEPSQKASDEVVAEPPLPKRSKKTKQSEGAADKPVEPTGEEPTKTTGGSAISPNVPAPAPEDAVDAKAPAKKEAKRVKAAPAKTAAPETLVMAPTTPATTAAASVQTEAPTSEAKPVAQEGKKNNKTGAKAEPAAASNTISSAAASASPDRAESAVAAKEQTTKPAVLRAPALKVDQHIALHAIVTLLQQEVLAHATMVTANTGALKTHLLHGITKLGHTCVEGSSQSFQRVGWHTTDDCLDYSPPILKHPEQFLQSAKTKGDLKLESPALFVQLRAYPDFGSESPLLQGAKAFKTAFLRTIDEVAAGESDVFVFICAEKVYQEFALQAVPTLPSTTTIQRHALTFALAHTAKNSAVSNLRSLVSRVENAAGECYIVAAILP